MQSSEASKGTRVRIPPGYSLTLDRAGDSTGVIRSHKPRREDGKVCVVLDKSGKTFWCPPVYMEPAK